MFSVTIKFLLSMTLQGVSKQLFSCFIAPTLQYNNYPGLNLCYYSTELTQQHLTYPGKYVYFGLYAAGI